MWWAIAMPCLVALQVSLLFDTRSSGMKDWCIYLRNFQLQINLFKGTGRESLQTVELITPGIREPTYGWMFTLVHCFNNRQFRTWNYQDQKLTDVKVCMIHSPTHSPVCEAVHSSSQSLQDLCRFIICGQRLLACLWGRPFQFSNNNSITLLAPSLAHITGSHPIHI